MSKIKPNFSALDAVHPKSEDFKRMLDYTVELIESLGQTFNPGILFGLQLSAIDGTTLSLSPGAAMSENGDIIVVESGEVTLPISTIAPYFFGEDNLGDIWLYYDEAGGVVQRADQDGVLQTVASKNLYTVSMVSEDATGDFDTPRVKLGTTISQIDDNSPTQSQQQFLDNFTWSNTATYIDYRYALESLTHTGELNSDGKYTGPQLGPGSLADDAVQTANIADGAVTNNKVSSNSTDAIDGSKIADASIDANTKLYNLNISGAMLSDFTIPETKLSRDTTRKVKIPSWVILPTAVISGGSQIPSYAALKWYNDDTNNFISRQDFQDFNGDQLNSQHEDWLTVYSAGNINPDNNILFSHEAISATTDPYLILFGRTDCWGSAGNSYPEYAKISNYLAAGLGYPGSIELEGIWPFVRPLYNTQFSGNWGYTPYIIPPDGYVIDSIICNLSTVDFVSGASVADPYYAPLVEVEPLHGPNWWTWAGSWNLSVANRMLNTKTLVGTKGRAIVGHWGVANWGGNSSPVAGVFTSGVNINIKLRYVDPNDATTDNPYGIGFNVSDANSSTVTFTDFDSGDYSDPNTLPFYLQQKVNNKGTSDGTISGPEDGETSTSSSSVLNSRQPTKMWSFIDRNSLI